MRKILLIGLAFAGSFVAGAKDKAAVLNLIPKPTSIEVSKGAGYAIKPNCLIFSDNEGKAAANYLKDAIKSRLNITVAVKSADVPITATSGSISFAISPNEKYGPEGYNLSVTPKGIEVLAGSPRGLLLSVSTLLQLLPLEGKAIIPSVKIFDKPHFGWRSIMLDVCRHFYTKQEVKRYIDLLSFYKFNTLHLHLSEDQGWRIEIKKYPKLTEVGAWRTQADGSKYGGFYTQDDIKDIVAYATSRGIDIIPEIEFPGHATAALAAYPQLSCTGGPFEVQSTWGVFNDVYCAGNEETFSFMEDVLTEVMNLFPNNYLHIGGDECPKVRWKNCPKCQQRIIDNNLKNEFELQSYFIHRIEKFINSKGHQLIGWDEIIEGGLAPNATVMVWRGWEHGVQAAKEGHNVIMTPTSHSYFDYTQETIDMEKAYAFNPIPEDLPAEFQQHILGGGATLWTERIPNSDLADFMLFPRAIALSEALWNGKDKEPYANFKVRINREYPRLAKMGVKFGPEGKALRIEPQVDYANKTLHIAITEETSGLDVRYTLDGNSPTLNSSKLLNGSITLKEKGTAQIQAFRNGYPYGSTIVQQFEPHKAIGMPVKFINPIGKAYPGLHPNCLTDGLRGSTSNFRDGIWQGIGMNDMVVEIPLDSTQIISSVKVGMLQNVSSWIFFPFSVYCEVSNNGTEFTPVSSAQSPVSIKTGEVMGHDFVLNFEPQKAKLIRITAKNIGICPEWHPGKGGKAWLFFDEIIVN